jgi:molybdate transport system permease protein
MISLAPDEIMAIAVSLKVASVGAIVALVVGAPLGLAMARGAKADQPSVLLEVLAHLPVIAPPVVVGLLLLMLLGANAPLGGFLASLGLPVAFTTFGAGLAAGVVAIPFAARAAHLAFAGVAEDAREAAQASGASPMDTFVSITLPLAAPGLIAGALTAFAVCLGEFGAVATFAASIPGETQTLPLAIYANLQSPGGEEKALRLALLSVLLAALAVIAARLIERRFSPALRAVSVHA